MRHPKAALWASAVALASLTLGGCSSDLPSSNSSAVSQSEPELTAAVKDRLLERLGRGLARALKDPAVRAWVSREMAASPYVEYRVPIRDKVLNGSNRPELRTVGREAGLTASDLTLLRKFPHLELYMPLENQRGSWRGGAEIQVAVRRPSKDYAVFQTDGSKKVVQANYLPAKPTLVLAISEIDYANREGGLRGGRNTGDYMQVQQPFTLKARRPMYSVMSVATMGIDASQWTRSYSHYIVNRHDGGLAGDDEMEIFGWVGGAYPECRRYTGLKQGVQYTRLLHSSPVGIYDAIALAVPTAPTVTYVEAWEDDDTACVKKPSDDFYGALNYSRAMYNVQQWLQFSNGPGLPPNLGDAKLGITEYVNGQPDPTP